MQGRRSLVQLMNDPSRSRISLGLIAENEVQHFPHGGPLQRRISKTVSDAGSSNLSMKRAIGNIKPKLEMEHSYRTEPAERFPYSTVSKNMQLILDSHLNNVKYDNDICKALSNQISDLIKDEVRSEIKNIERYKLVCWVSIGQVTGQDVRVASRCLWSTEHDTCSTALFRNTRLFGVATLHALYYDGCWNYKHEA